jgi:hypothetical protein
VARARLVDFKALMLAANFYVPVYDTIFLAAPVVLAAQGSVDRRQLQVWLLALYLVPCLTQTFAEFAHVQLMTPLIAGFGVWLIWPRMNAHQRE